MAKVKPELVRELTRIASQQILVALRFKQPRLEEIRKSEDLYLGKNKKALKGRFNVPFPFLTDFVDKLQSKLDDEITLKFKERHISEMKGANMTTALWQVDSAPQEGDWQRVDRWSRFLAIMSGRAIYKYYASSENGYVSNFEAIDYNDFLCEPNGGADLKKHLFLGQINIFRTKADLIMGAESGYYDDKEVSKLIGSAGAAVDKKTYDTYKDQNNRFIAVSLDIETNSYVGQQVFNLCEWYMVYGGKMYYLFIELKTNICIRCVEVSEMFPSCATHPFESWATNEDPKNFWSRGPADVARPVHEVMSILMNQEIDNRQKQNFGQRAYDSRIFPDPSQLEYRPDGLVVAKASENGKNISEGIYEFKTPQLQGTVNLVEYLDNMTGRGVSANQSGQNRQDSRVGIYYANMQEVADNIGRFNKSRINAITRIGYKYHAGLLDNMDEKRAVKVIGPEGASYEEVFKKDLDSKYGFDVVVVSKNAQMASAEMEDKAKSNAIQMIMTNPILLQNVSPKKTVEELLRMGRWSDEDIKIWMEVKNDSSKAVVAEAYRMIDLVLNKEDWKPYRGADTTFMQTILDFAYDENLSLDEFNALTKMAEAHTEFVQENAINKHPCKTCRAREILSKHRCLLWEAEDQYQDKWGLIMREVKT
jgi:hypothetical protein